MKYNIRINQKALYDNHLENKLKMEDLVLFDFIHDFFNSVSPNKMVYEFGGERYIEIKLSLIQEQIPILNIHSRQTLNSRLNKLISAGLIERYENNQKENRSCYKRGPKWDIFTFYEVNINQEYERDENDFTTCQNDLTPCQNKPTPCQEDFTRRVKKIGHNNNIIDNNTERETRTYTREGDEAFVNTFLSSSMANILRQQYGADEATMQSAISEVMAQWDVSRQRHADYTDKVNHLVNQLRIKLDVARKKTETRTQKEQPYGIQQQQTFRQQDRQQDFSQYAAAHAEVERRRREEQYGRDDDTGDIL